MTLPSSTFNIADWSSSNVSIDSVSEGVLLVMTSSRGSPNITASAGRVRLISTDGVSSALRYPVSIDAIHSLEFRIEVSALPRSVEDADQHRFFIGCLNAQGSTTGLLLAQDGIAVTADPTADVVPLSGSSSLIPVVGSSVTVRLLVNGRGGTAALYVTDTTQLATTGHVLRRSVALGKSRGKLGDLLYVDALGSGADSVDVSLYSLRVGNGIATPEKRPQVNIEANTVTGVAVLTSLDATGSSVPGNPTATLGYVWRIISRPEGSFSLLEGREDAGLLRNSVRFTPVAPGASGNDVVLVFTDPGLGGGNTAIAITVVANTITIVLQHDGTGVSGQTTATKLVNALTNSADSAYSPAAAALISAVVEGDGETITTAGTEATSGGVDSTSGRTSFVPDLEGLYEFGLTVSGAELSASESVISITCLRSEVEIGRTPDLSFLWDHLPDFSRTVAGHEVMEHVWRAALRLTAAELLRAAQIDYAKSIRDVPSVMQHKWVSFPLTYRPKEVTFYGTPQDNKQMYPYDDRDGDTTTPMLRHTSTVATEVGAPVSLYLTTGPVTALCKSDAALKLSTSTATFTSTSDTVTGSGFGVAQAAAGDVVLILIAGSYEGFSIRAVISDTQMRLDRPVGATASGSGTLQIGGLLTLDADVVPVYLLIDEGAGTGVAVDDGAGPATTTLWFGLSYGAFNTTNYAVGDRLLIGESLAYLGINCPSNPASMPAYASTSSGYLVVTTSSPAVPLDMEEDQNVSWQVLRYKAGTALTVGFPRGIEFDALDGVSPGDVLLLRTEEGEPTFASSVIRGVSGSTIALGNAHGPPESGLDFTILRIMALPVDERVQSLPRLQLAMDSTYYLVEGKHHVVDGAEITLLGVEGDDGVWAQDADGVITFTSALSDFSALTLAPGGASSWVVVTLDTAAGQPCFVSPVSSVLDATTLVLTSSDGDYSGTTSRFIVLPVPYSTLSLLSPAWWAEYAYTDNSEMVEANFGNMMGLQKSEFDIANPAGGPTGYLHAVRALHYALWMGPTVYNLELGVQALLGLPFSEVAGTILSIDSSFSANFTRVQVTGTDNVVRSYMCPAVVALAKHPDTGLTLAEGDVIPAYTMLTQGAQVLDYINTPGWYDGWLDGVNILQKFHKFLVTFDLRAVEISGNEASLVARFLDRAKPKHTDYIIAGSYGIDPVEIDILESCVGDATLGATEDLYTTPDGPLFSGVVATPTTTSVTLGSEASAVSGLYVGLSLTTLFGGVQQTATITAYSVGRVASVAAWPLGTPTAATAYQIHNPPPFTSGMTAGLDQYDGRGNWNRATSSVLWPSSGSPPTAVVNLTGITGTFQADEELRNAAGDYVGRVRYFFTPVLYVDVDGASVPAATDVFTGSTSGATGTVASATIGSWPTYSYINRHRSEVWVPLEHNTAIGQVETTTTATAYTAVGGSGGPELTVAATADVDTYVNYRVKRSGTVARVIAHDGTVLYLSDDIGASIGNTITLHPPKPRARLLGLDFFEPGTWVVGSTSGHRAQVYYFGPSYLLLRNPDFNPYASFVRGEVLTGENGETATAVDGVFYVYPDAVATLDRNKSLELHCERRLCFYAGADGVDPALDMGLALDDVELFQKPYDSSLPDSEQYVPSHGPGLYWWIDNKLVYNSVDEEPAGPDSGEPPWVASPEVVIGTVSTDPGWSDMVLHDTGICRVVSEDGEPPLGATVPDPMISAIL